MNGTRSALRSVAAACSRRIAELFTELGRLNRLGVPAADLRRIVSRRERAALVRAALERKHRGRASCC